jgi:hypothetical protein
LTSSTKSWKWLHKRSGKKAWAVRVPEWLNGMLGSGQTEKHETGEDKSQKHAHHCLRHQGDCLQIIRSGGPNSQFRILLWTFMATAWKFGKTSLRNFDDKRTGCWITTTHHLSLPSSPGNFLLKITWLSSPTTLIFPVSPTEDKIERSPFLHNWGYRGRIAGGAERPHFEDAFKNGRSTGNGAYVRMALCIPQTEEPTYRRLILVH